MGIVRTTKSVRLVSQYFEENENAIGVLDLIERYKEDMNRSTIYRILDRLEDEGKVHAFLGPNGLKHYARCKECSHTEHLDIHPHFQCVKCGKVECVSTEIIVPTLPDKKITHAQMLLSGTCADCSH